MRKMWAVNGKHEGNVTCSSLGGTDISKKILTQAGFEGYVSQIRTS
jgi:hypothetical protein